MGWKLPRLALVALLLLFTADAVVAPAARTAVEPSAAHTLLVRWHTAPPEAAELPAGLTRLEPLAWLGLERYAAEAADLDDLLTTLAADPRVEFAERDRPYRLLAMPDDPLVTEQWNLKQVRAPEAWDVATGGADVIVAVLDSGIDPTHPELVGRVVPGRNVRERNGNTQDDIGHGTHVAGVIGARGDNGVGVAGVSWGVRLMPIKITDRLGDASIVAAADGIRWATENGARVINLSFGGLDDSRTVRLAIEDAYKRGVLLVAAAGNCGEVASFRDEGCETVNPPIYPAALNEVIAVGALGANGELAPYSETGTYIRLTAPGGVGGSRRANPLDYVLSAWPPAIPSPIDIPGYSYEVGTSMAAPHVAGAAALVWSTNPTLMRDEVEQVLFETADNLGAPGRNDRYGYGRLNVQRAVERAARLPGNRGADIRVLLESPRADAVINGPLTVRGWAVDQQAEGGTGIDIVEAWLDGPPGQGTPLGRLPYGTARPDVARLLDRGGFTNAGFSIAAPVSHGLHTLYVRAHSSLSGVWSTGQVRFIATGSPATPQVPAPTLPSSR
jgi:subtilisin family serine protease